jgi:hypothetical protein
VQRAQHANDDAPARANAAAVLERHEHAPVRLHDGDTVGVLRHAHERGGHERGGDDHGHRRERPRDRRPRQPRLRRSVDRRRIAVDRLGAEDRAAAHGGGSSRSTFGTRSG